MQRTAWRGFGDGDAASGGYDPGDPAGNPAAGSIQDLIDAQNARPVGSNVDTFTALQSKFSAAVPAGARLPLVLATVGLLALILLPDGGRGRQ